jgi:hypothetical protein
MLHRVYLAPGMFGFGRLASYDYFAHVERALGERLAVAGASAEFHVLEVPPTASVRRRAARLAELVSRTSRAGDGPIHLLGHSTGGLDARLVASPSAHLPVAPETMAWLPRLRTVTTMNTPHYGTPLASFFATVSGQRMLYALSALTFVGLTFGSPPLAAASALIGMLGRVDSVIGLEIRIIDRSVDTILRVLDDARSREVRLYLEAIKQDQGAVIQLTPEAMDLFQAGVEDRPGVLYQSTASMAPPPSASGWVRSIGRPWTVLSSTLFTTLHRITARYDERYPCCAANAGEQAEAALARAFGRAPGARANDGVVPIRSQIWGELVWAGLADHLDVLGHFRADLAGTTRDERERHVDWLASGSSFDRGGFASLMDAIAKGMRMAS